MSNSAWLPEIRANPEGWLAAIIRSGDAALALELLHDHPPLLERRLAGNATPLLVAALSEQQRIAEALLESGAKMDFVAAIALRRFGSVRAMLEANRSLVRKHSPDGWSVLHVAACHSTPEIVALLITAGADVDSLDERRMTPLFFATRPPFDNARLLLSHGANINAQGKHGFTPLHCAARWGYAAWVQFLIEHGANAKLQTDARQTPWALAVRHGHREVATLLVRS